MSEKVCPLSYLTRPKTDIVTFGMDQSVDQPQPVCPEDCTGPSEVRERLPIIAGVIGPKVLRTIETCPKTGDSVLVPLVTEILRKVDI